MRKWMIIKDTAQCYWLWQIDKPLLIRIDFYRIHTASGTLDPGIAMCDTLGEGKPDIAIGCQAAWNEGQRVLYAAGTSFEIIAAGRG